MKIFWRGRDIDELSREELIEVIQGLAKQVESVRQTLSSVLEINKLSRIRRGL